MILIRKLWPLAMIIAGSEAVSLSNMASDNDEMYLEASDLDY